MSPRHVVPLLGMYLSQGVSYGYIGWVLIPRLSAAGVPVTEQVGVIALSQWPVVLKCLLAPLLDVRLRLRSRRGQMFCTPAVWMIAAMLGVAASAFGLATVVERTTPNLSTIWGLLISQSLALAVQDVATDAQIFDTVPQGHRGRIQSGLLLSQKFGSDILGGMVLGGEAGRRGLGFGLWVHGILGLFLALLPVGLLQGGKGRPPKSDEAKPSATVGRILSNHAPPSVWVFVMCFCALALAVDVATSAVSGHFLIQRLAWPVERITGTLTWVAFGSGLMGYAIALKWVDRMRAGAAVTMGCVASGLSTVAFGVSEALWSHEVWILLLSGVQSLLHAWFMVALYRWLMNYCPTGLRATGFATLMALLNAPRTVVPLLAPPLLAWLDFAGFYALLGLFQVGLVALVAGAEARRPAEV